MRILERLFTALAMVGGLNIAPAFKMFSRQPDPDALREMNARLRLAHIQDQVNPEASQQYRPNYTLGRDYAANDWTPSSEAMAKRARKGAKRLRDQSRSDSGSYKSLH